MRTKVLLGFVAAAAALLAAQTRAIGSPPAPTSLLIRYRVISTDSFTEVTSTFDGFIFRDGLVIERLTNDVGKCLIVRAAALPERLSRLQSALVSNHVGVQQGNCTNEPPGDFTVERQVTWFGRGGRQHSYRYDFGGPLCPSSLDQIDHAITAVFGGATDAQTAETCP